MYYGEPTSAGGIIAQDPELAKMDRTDEFSGGSVSGVDDPGFWDIFWAADKAAQTADNFNANRLGEEHAIDEKNDRIKSVLGIAVDNPYRVYGGISKEQSDRGLGHVGSPHEYWRYRIEEIAKARPEHRSWLAPERDIRAEAALVGNRAAEDLNTKLSRYDHWTGNMAAF